MQKTKYKVGDLVRVRDDAGKLHHGNTRHEGQLGVVTEARRATRDHYALLVKMLSTGALVPFDDEELDDEEG
jgi:hypothetical protein